MLGYRTFTLCLVALITGSVALLLGTIGGGEYTMVIGAVAGMWGINDLAGGYRERALRSGGPDTVANVEARTVNVNPETVEAAPAL